MPRAEIEITNKLGLHARASAKLTQLAGGFQSEVWMEKGSRRINAKSIMGVMMLAAGIVIEPVVELLPMPSSAVYGRGFWAIITLVVMAPLLEEFLCRGIILESVRAKYGVVAALFLSSAFFAVLHGHPALAVNAFVMGLILGFIYIETNSIFSVVLLHAMNNGAAFLLIMVGLDGATIRSVIGSDTLYTIVYVVALVLFAASGYMIYRLLARVKKLDKNTIR